jgi:flagellar basal-body rod protein FlgC
MPTLISAISASASALAVERARLETAVSNLANADSTRGPDGLPYRRRGVVLASDPVPGFEAAVGRATAIGVRVAEVVEDQSPFKRIYQPGHPDADPEGFVAMPNVEPAEEMIDMVGAARAYQANLAAIGLVRDMVQKSLELAK